MCALAHAYASFHIFLVRLLVGYSVVSVCSRVALRWNMSSSVRQAVYEQGGCGVRENAVCVLEERRGEEGRRGEGEEEKTSFTSSRKTIKQHVIMGGRRGGEEGEEGF